MKGVVLAAGQATRMFPITKVTNKHLLPIATKPMLYYPITTLTKAGIDEILIVTNVKHIDDMAATLESGDFDDDIGFTYKIQKKSGGIAEALYLAKDFVGDDNVAVILGDNIFEDDVEADVHLFDANFQRIYNEEGFVDSCAQIFTKEVEDPERFGVALISMDGKVQQIEEKPKHPKSRSAVTGLYLYTPDVFNVIPQLKRSERGELEITDVNMYYVDHQRMKAKALQGFWSDAGVFSSYHECCNWAWKQNLK